MVQFEVREFLSGEALLGAAADDMEGALTGGDDGPRAVMLSGGNTPRAIYEELQRRGGRAAEGVSVLYSDERFVAETSPESNYGLTVPLLTSLGVPPSRVVRVRMEGELIGAAARYDHDLAAVLASGGRITLGWLGLGADGHTASLFSPADVERGRGHWAVAVPRDVKPDRVSVTPDLLDRIDRLVLLVSGREKVEITTRLLQDPASVVAGMAFKNRARVELWRATCS